MRHVNRLFQPPKTSTRATATTAHGLPAFERPIEEQLMQALLCNTIGDTFYADKKGMLDETKRVHELAIAHDVDFYARALAWARTRGLMRTQAVYGLALLATRSHDLDPAERTLDDERTTSYFDVIFADVIKTPNDLMDFHAILRAFKGNDGGRRVKRVAGAWLRDNLTEYWAIKYGAQKPGAFSLRDLFRIYHPSSAGKNKPLVNWLLGRAVEKEKAEIELAQVWAFEQLKIAKTPLDKAAFIRAGRLPHEVATSFAGKDAAAWGAIVEAMPAFALIRHLATIERQGVMNAVRPIIVKKLGSPGVAKAKIFPFAFLQALEKVQDAEVQDALRMGLEHCLGSAETLPGKTLVALDISGSMAALLQKSAIFSIAVARRGESGSMMILFNEMAHAFSVSKVDSVLTQAAKVRCNGGTDHGAIVQFLFAYGQRFDNIVIVTDEQQERGSPFVDAVDKWRNTREGRGSKFFVANLGPYTQHGSLLPAGRDNFSVFGMTEASIQFIAKAARGWDTFVNEVRSGGAQAEGDASAELDEVGAE